MDLLERCKQQDPAAQREFITRRVRQVYRWAVLLGLGPRDAEDAAQEVLATAMRRIACCRSSEAVTSWLYQITRRVAANTRRLSWWRRVLLSEQLEAHAFAHPSPAAVDEELDLRRCLGRLPRKLAEVLMLVEIEGYTRDEVAGMLGIPPGTVASRLRLARDAFRAEWQGAAAPAGLSRGEET